jgi:formate dehydrogenase subunit beta
MRVDRLVKVGEDGPLAAVHNVLHGLWERNGLVAMLGPLESEEGREVAPQVAEEPHSLAAINPFAPVMPANAAALIVGFAREHQPGPLAAVLRPCEWRAVVELRKRHRTTPEADRVISVVVDCLGCHSSEVWNERARVTSPADIWHDALTYADQGGFTPKALRRGCQMCTSPASREVDLTIGLFGLNTSHALLVSCPDEDTDERLHMAEIAPELAPEDVIVRREVALGELAERRGRQRDLLFQDAQRRGVGLAEVLGLFANCSLCGDCLDACPLYNGELAGMLGARTARHSGRSLLAELVDLGRWLASCSGCGMCEEVCSSGVPLLDIVSPLSQRVRDETAYRPGERAAALPWVAGNA